MRQGLIWTNALNAESKLILQIASETETETGVAISRKENETVALHLVQPLKTFQVSQEVES